MSVCQEHWNTGKCKRGKHCHFYHFKFEKYGGTDIKDCLELLNNYSNSGLKKIINKCKKIRNIRKRKEKLTTSGKSTVF